MNSTRAFGLGLGLVIAMGVAPGQIPTCPGAGLSVTGGRFGDAWSVGINGPPGAAALVATDVPGGPVLTPFGPLCLGLTPALVTFPTNLDASGSFAMSGLLPLAPTFPAGTTLSVQAALAHPSLPGGYSLTNAAAVTFRPPQMASFRGSPTFALDLIDGVTDTIVHSPAVPIWQGGDDPLHMRSLGWYGIRSYGSLYCIEDTTGANVLTIPGVFTPWTQTTIASDDGFFLFAFDLTSPMVTVRTWSLPSGALLSTWATPDTFYSNRGLYHIPGTSLIYACGGVAGTQIFVVDGATGTLVTMIQLGGSLHGGFYWPSPHAFLWQGYLYAVAGGSLVVIDTTTHTMVGSPVPIGASAVSPLGIGPGASGPALWLALWNPSGYSLAQVSLATLAMTTVASLQGWPTHCMPTAGWTELLLMEGGTVFVVNPVTNLTYPLLTGMSELQVLRSGTLTKAYASSSLTVFPGVYAFATDPVTLPGTVISLPGSGPPLIFTHLVSN